MVMSSGLYGDRGLLEHGIKRGEHYQVYFTKPTLTDDIVREARRLLG